MMKLYKKMTAVCLGVSLSLAATPAIADDVDVLGQSLERNFPAQRDPSGVLAVSKAEQVEAQAMTAGPLFPSQSALIMSNKTGEVLYQKNANRMMPIASISKLMSATVLLDADLNMDELVTITPEEIDRLGGTGNRLSTNVPLPRKELLHLSLMGNENRATHALARTCPGGINTSVAAMNAKAQSLGMNDSRFYEPAGLDYRNVSAVHDLSRLVAAASRYPLIRRSSTFNCGVVSTASGSQRYKNSNALVRKDGWNTELQRAGYIREVDHSMVIKANVQNQPITIVLLNSSPFTTCVDGARKIESWMLQCRS